MCCLVTTFQDVSSNFHGARAWDLVGVSKPAEVEKSFPHIREFSGALDQRAAGPDMHRAGKRSLIATFFPKKKMRRRRENDIKSRPDLMEFVSSIFSGFNEGN